MAKRESIIDRVKKRASKFADDYQTGEARDKAVREHMNRGDIPWERRVKVVKKLGYDKRKRGS